MFVIGFSVWNERLGDADEENSWSRGKTGASADRTDCSNDGLDSTFDRIQNVQSSMAFVAACSFRAFSRRSIVFTNIYFRHVFVAAISPEQCATLFYVLCVDTINDTLGMLRGKRATDLYYFGVPFISESIRRETHVKSIFVYLVSDIAKERYFIITLLKMENNHRRVFQKCRSS